MNGIKAEAAAILRAVSRAPERLLDGAELMELIFASTSETPMDSEQICNSVAQLEAQGFLLVDRQGVVDPEFDFATVRITDRGLKHIQRR